MIALEMTPNGAELHITTRPGRLWSLILKLRRWQWGRSHSLCTRAIAVGPVKVALTDVTWPVV